MRQIYAASAVSVSAFGAAVASNHVGGVSSTSAGVFVDFLDASTTTEQSNVRTIATGAPYNLTFMSNDVGHQADQWDPRAFGSALVCWLNPGNLPHMWQEPLLTQQITPVTATGQVVGSIQDVSPLAQSIIVSGNTQPILNSDDGVEAHLTFTNSGSGNQPTINNSTKGLAFLNSAPFSIHLMIRSAAEGVQYQYLDNCALDGSRFGIHFRKNSNDTLFFRMCCGLGSTTFAYNASGTQTLKVADGMALVSINYDGTTLTIQINNKTVDTIPRLNTPVAGNPTVDLFIGHLSNSTGTPFAGDMRGLVILNRATTTAERAALATFMGRVRLSTTLLFQPSTIGWMQPCAHFHDFTVPQLPAAPGASGGGGLWQDLARTTPVATNGDTIAVCDHQLDPTNQQGRSLTSSILAAGPVYRPALSNPGGEWNGAASGSNTNMNIPGPVWMGSWTVLMVVNNRDQVNGSHIVIASGAHFPITGNNYVSNPSANTPYSTCHFSGSDIGGTVLLPQLNPLTMLQELTRNGNNVRLRVCKYNPDEYVGVTIPNTNVTRWTPLSMGNETIVGWALDGIVTFFGMWPVCLTRQQVNDYLMKFLQARFPNVPVFS